MSHHFVTQEKYATDRSEKEEPTANPNNLIVRDAKNVSQYLTVSLFYNSIGEELNNELDAFLPESDLKQDTDYCENLQLIADYIECTLLRLRDSVRSPLVRTH